MSIKFTKNQEIASGLFLAGIILFFGISHLLNNNDSVKTQSTAIPSNVSAQCYQVFKNAEIIDATQPGQRVQNTIPALDKCNSVAEYVAAAKLFPTVVKAPDVKTYLMNRCSSADWEPTKICQSIAKDPKVKTTYYLAFPGSSDRVPAGDQNNMQAFLEAANSGNHKASVSIALNAKFDLLDDNGSVDVVSTSGDVTQVRLHPTEDAQAHLKDKLRWVPTKCVQHIYEVKY